MSGERARNRTAFETSELMQKAIRIRGAVDGLRPSGVINAALRTYLAREIALVRERLGEAGPGAGAGGQDAPRKGKQATRGRAVAGRLRAAAGEPAEGPGAV